jgi:hypothetical protein
MFLAVNPPRGSRAIETLPPTSVEGLTEATSIEAAGFVLWKK